jgi:hypothetical protein
MMMVKKKEVREELGKLKDGAQEHEMDKWGKWTRKGNERNVNGTVENGIDGKTVEWKER